MEIALYEPGIGYYSRQKSPIGKTGDFVTSTSISPVFSFAISRLVREWMSRISGTTFSIVDVGCGDGALIRAIATEIPDDRAQFFGVDRSLERAVSAERVQFATTFADVPLGDAQLLICNELFDALPFARLVMREEGLHELWVGERAGRLEWIEHDADPQFANYFSVRGIQLQNGQFADVTPGWEDLYGELCGAITRGLVLTFDYGYPGSKLFSSRARRFGTAAAYSQHQVSRDLLANPGDQDLTAHINFTDLEGAGSRAGFSTLYFDRQAKFLLALGATEHDAFKPVEQRGFESADEALKFREEREQARRLVLPDGIGEEMRVLVQGKGLAEEGWSFQKRLF